MSDANTVDPNRQANASRAQEIAEQAEQHFRDNPGRLFIPNRGIPNHHNVQFGYESEAEAFPDVQPNWTPLGSLVMVLIRQPKYTTAGGIEIPDDTVQTDHDNTQVGKVVALGPLAFRRRDDGSPWPEGAWCKVGDYVHVPKYGGDRQVVDFMAHTRIWDNHADCFVTHMVKRTAVFAAFKDLAIAGIYTSLETALSARAFI
jgi:co-chaperonin GroES (HSP10)